MLRQFDPEAERRRIEREVHARPSENTPALCSAEPGEGKWTTKRSQVTCIRCIDEICRRQAAKDERRGRPPR
jgi:hypothetical protein